MPRLAILFNTLERIMNELKQHYEKIQSKALKDFLTFLSFQSISTDPQYKQQVCACADWLTQEIKKIGFLVEQWSTNGHPVLFATNLEAGPDKPTLLIYNHYDVQPVDPESEWDTPPFEPSQRHGEIYARGAQDNKGQCFYVLQALKYFADKKIKLPINIKWIIEGEEESGSTGLSHLLEEKKRQEQLKADYLVIVDMGIPNLQSPAITLGVRGLVTMEVRVQGSKGDMHSGSHGGIVYNPLHALVEILSKLRTPDGKVNIPGFYSDVQEMSAEDKQHVSFDFNVEEYENMFHTKATGGEKGYSPHERAWIRPTLEINGINGGYGGAGFKTVLPGSAIAKVSCRLVPNQDPNKIGMLVANQIKKLAPEGVKVDVHLYPGMGLACRAKPDSKVAKAFSKAYEELFQKPCKNIYDGGSIPIAAKLAKASGSELILMGFGLPDDQIHAPNEHFGIDRLEKGFCVMVRAIELLGKK